MTAEACSVVEIHDAPRRMPGTYGEEEEYWKKEARDWKKLSIYKVPAYVRDLKTQAYQPQVVSLGPYHHDEEHLKPMEKHKARALFYFLKRSGKPLEGFQEALSEVLDNLMDCYDQLDEKWRSNRDAFLQLMILDGAFMLEILSTWTDSSNDYPDNDPIFGHHGKLYIKPVLQRDMLMLENQLPMLVLNTLVAVKSDGLEKDKEFVNKLILEFCCPSVKKDMGECLHLLDVFRKSLLLGGQSNSNGEGFECLHLLDVFRRSGGQSNSNGEGSKSDDTVKMIRSATELQDTGIRFKRSRTTSLKDISFSRGTLRLPTITVDNTTESKFLNLIAFELLHIGIGNEISSYIRLMVAIIDSKNDVALLHDERIITTAIGSDKATAELFNSLSKEVPLSLSSSLQTVHNEISNYCELPFNKWRANLIRRFFWDPWSFPRLLNAFSLLWLSVIQTIYTVHK